MYTDEEIVEWKLQLAERDRAMKAVNARLHARYDGNSLYLYYRTRLFAAEYAVCFDGASASRVAGYKGNREKFMMQNPAAQTMVQVKLDDAEAISDLKAAYVRQYIHDVLEFSPLKFFVPAPEGGWLITEESFNKLPQRVRRLVEHVELRTVKGVNFMALKFVSKTAALAMAARYTLTQNFNATVTNMPWDEIAGKLEREAQDPIAKRLAEVDQALASERA